MPRLAGQFDERKREAVLDAAQALFAERGLAASMDEIARRAGVSRQTLYNRFASKLEIAEALAHRRSDAITAPLRAGGEPRAVLMALAQALLDRACDPEKGASMRGVVLVAAEAPNLARRVYDAGPGESLSRLAAWLAEQDRTGRLSIPDPATAAEMFTGMVLGHASLRSMLGVPMSAAEMPHRAAEATDRFLRAFAVGDPGETP